MRSSRTDSESSGSRICYESSGSRVQTGNYDSRVHTRNLDSRVRRALLARLIPSVAPLAPLALVAALAASAIPHALRAQASAPQRHMLFRVQAPAGGTVYLLGSVHLLTPESAKLPAEVDSAFAHAGAIAFETNLDSLQRRSMELLARGRYAGTATLRTSLSAAGAVKADSVLKLYGLSLDQVNQFKPWFVSVLLSQMVMQRAHFQAQLGVESQLNARAKEAGKPVIGLEANEVQLGIFDRIPAADQELMLTGNKGPDSAAKVMLAVKDAWASGNTAAIDSLLNKAATESPATFAIMVADRNRSWIPKIEELLAAKNDALVVIGAAHLVGAQGLIELLRTKGYMVDQGLGTAASKDD